MIGRMEGNFAIGFCLSFMAMLVIVVGFIANIPSIVCIGILMEYSGIFLLFIFVWQYLYKNFKALKYAVKHLERKGIGYE